MASSDSLTDSPANTTTSDIFTLSSSNDDGNVRPHLRACVVGNAAGASTGRAPSATPRGTTCGGGSRGSPGYKVVVKGAKRSASQGMTPRGQWDGASTVPQAPKKVPSREASPTFVITTPEEQLALVPAVPVFPFPPGHQAADVATVPPVNSNFDFPFQDCNMEVCETVVTSMSACKMCADGSIQFLEQINSRFIAFYGNFSQRQQLFENVFAEAMQEQQRRDQERALQQQVEARLIAAEDQVRVCQAFVLSLQGNFSNFFQWASQQRSQDEVLLNAYRSEMEQMKIKLAYADMVVSQALVFAQQIPQAEAAYRQLQERASRLVLEPNPNCQKKCHALQQMLDSLQKAHDEMTKNMSDLERRSAEAEHFVANAKIEGANLLANVNLLQNEKKRWLEVQEDLHGKVNNLTHERDQAILNRDNLLYQFRELEQRAKEWEAAASRPNPAMDDNFYRVSDELKMARTRIMELEKELSSVRQSAVQSASSSSNPVQIPIHTPGRDSSHPGGVGTSVGAASGSMAALNQACSSLSLNVAPPIATSFLPPAFSTGVASGVDEVKVILFDLLKVERKRMDDERRLWEERQKVMEAATKERMEDMKGELLMARTEFQRAQTALNAAQVGNESEYHEEEEEDDDDDTDDDDEDEDEVVRVKSTTVVAAAPQPKSSVKAGTGASASTGATVPVSPSAPATTTPASGGRLVGP